MKKWIAAVVIMAASSPAYAQTGKIGSYTQPQVNPHPAVSPYLNMTRGGTNVATDYYGIVRPQLETQQTLQNLQSGLTQVQTDVATVHENTANNPMTESGHNITFFNYSHYFPTGANRFAGTQNGAVFGGAGGGGTRR